ncbi:Pre-mRNA-splicing factor ATP-dependent RNA helicase PRP43 [Cytospora mali]|uniref:Pre-mRNA-splicing factor ATP-dependent RNA helicase PRP43 n=1 Tax=Cytospora mali TaxID=578113 RepID=A0A194VWK4_CYTMA|nr:Pre-mRNA-splicing factor ATP-dependent RNA helicase PRP43 [Valsa mali]
MSKAQQQKALAPLTTLGNKENSRKYIVATNIAEISLTIDSIVYVVDCGLEKVMTYDPRLRIDILRVAPTSQASAKQRAGRAGSTRSGKCYRLYSEHAFNSCLIKHPLPEIQCCSMSGPIWDILTLQRDPRVDELLTFPYLENPTPC